MHTLHTWQRIENCISIYYLVEITRTAAECVYRAYTEGKFAVDVQYRMWNKPNVGIRYA